jgi:hypothetical protein
MKIPTTIAACTFIGLFTAHASLTVYDQAPDWTATDLNGNTHTLSSYLNDGYTVIIDFSVTWCIPCEELHESHVLKTLYQQYGPGTVEDKVMVFHITSGPEAWLHGEQGNIDWVTGTPYPIINDQSIHDLYGVFYYPHVLTVCNSGMVSSTQYSTNPTTMLEIVSSCDHMVADTPNDAALLGAPETSCLGPGSETFATLFNAGTEPLTSVQIEAIACGTGEVLSTTTWTGTLNTYEQVQVLVPGWLATTGSQCAQYRISTPDDDPTNNHSPIFPYQASIGVVPSTTLTLNVLTDDHGAAWSWSISNNSFTSSTSIAEGDYAPNTFYSQTIQLVPDDCWNFTITNVADTQFAAPGYYEVLANGVPFITPDVTSHLGGGMIMHSASFSTTGATGMASMTKAPSYSIRMDGNSATFYDLPLGAETMILDPLGRMVVSFVVSAPEMRVDLSDHAPGTYLALFPAERSLGSIRFAWVR